MTQPFLDALKGFAGVALIMLATISSAPVAAQPTQHAQPPPSDVVPLLSTASAPDTTGVPVNTAVPALSTFLQRVEQFHPKMLAARIDRDIARAALTEKRGAFDPQLEVYDDYMRYNGGSGKAKQATDNTVAVGWLTPDGLKMAVGYDYDRGAVKSPLSPTGTGGEVFFDLKLPLLRGFGINPKRAAERQAIVKTGTAEVYFGLTRLQVLLAASTAWWEWSAAERRLQVQRDVLDVAAKRAALIRKRVEAGDLAPFDGVEADAEVERRREVATKAERDVQKAAFKLSLYSWDADRQPGPPPPSSAALERLSLNSVTDEALGKATLDALETRPELRSLKLERQIVGIDLDLARNDKKPRVDFFVQPGYDAGNGGVGMTIKTGLSVTIPLRTREADGRIEAAQLRLSRLDVQQSNDVQTIVIEVRDAVNAVNNAVERHEIASKALALAEKLEQGERLRFELGDGTLFLVNQRERATAEARLKVVDIEADYAAALYTLWAVSARL